MTLHTHDDRRAIERQPEMIRPPPEPEAARIDRPWQVGFMLRFILHVTFYGWVLYWLLGKPDIPIRWLQ